ncbi:MULTISPECIES: hypothetical protein [Bradyrhizobium]|nr:MULTISPECIES: hypothetical protein [Bradyrhizobium]WLB44709.1 hypothetical protein QIH93_29885 [Bradyrhizobium ottawaense]WQN82006.1 hypothetical protein U7859_34345 [Bradyrhizobium ottawaense]BBO03376.1 hypothetical protein SG09_27260 [Bradyrhizobium ottawaense]GMO10608.1 hypothetical protein BwSH20_74360 [Bradyrhizobium ottawaense]GMO53071.1 hypothetical protein BwSH14_76200 [Bradyrhizobium ottawaense]
MLADHMLTSTREYIDFWIENSVHAAEQYGTPGASQSVDVLVDRLVEGAKNQNITRAAIEKEVGDLKQYIEEKLATANRIEQDRPK